ncbi:hypothetical protein A3835_08590 [Campylobacter concisus]|uniref:Uncharacterized protein n=1 Tax=Campylobacter concisus TaxID=199 RepID=A0A1X0U0K3_9BACT|nr:hypothetical protein A3835_08590 [Campylobacter concisus]
MKISITTAGKGGAIIAIEPKKIKEFTSHLRAYGVSSVKEAPQGLINMAYDLFYINKNLRKQVRELTEQGYDDENKQTQSNDIATND